jgi:hypothetical protein
MSLPKIASKKIILPIAFVFILIISGGTYTLHSLQNNVQSIQASPSPKNLEAKNDSTASGQIAGVSTESTPTPKPTVFVKPKASVITQKTSEPETSDTNSNNSNSGQNTSNNQASNNANPTSSPQTNNSSTTIVSTTNTTPSVAPNNGPFEASFTYKSDSGSVEIFANKPIKDYSGSQYHTTTKEDGSTEKLGSSGLRSMSRYACRDAGCGYYAEIFFAPPNTYAYNDPLDVTVIAESDETKNYNWP